MPRRLFDSEYIFGLHDPGGEQLMVDAGKPGWVLFTEELGHDPNDFSGRDYQSYSNRNLGIICRLNNGYAPNGTIPQSTYYADFAKRCANFVANTRGCKIWIIGNEMNHAIEQPTFFTQAMSPAFMSRMGEPSAPAPTTPPAQDGVITRVAKALLRSLSDGMGDAALFTDPSAAPVLVAAKASATSDADPYQHGSPNRFSALHPAPAAAVTRALAQPAAAAATSELITPDLYARCYKLCRDAIHAVPGHADDQVLVGAVAPWNNQTTYSGNANGDWVQYFQDLLNLLGPNGCDGITVHTYTHGSDPNLITNEQRMNAPFQNRRYHFRAYQDFMQAIPATMRQLPVYITETDQDDPWQDNNTGWVQRAYGEINAWNQQASNQQIRALILYRWPNIDRWVIQTKGGVINDFRQAVNNDHRWRVAVLSTLGINAGDQVETTDVVNMRRTPGYVGKPSSDIIQPWPAGTRMTILSATSRTVDNLIWWNVRATATNNQAVDGWVAEVAPSGQVLLTLVSRAAKPDAQPSPTGKFAKGDTVVTRDIVRMRQTPGYNGKTASDVVDNIPSGRQGKVLDGPRLADSLTWWQITINGSNNTPVTGWMAEAGPDGAVLLDKVATTTTPPVQQGTFAIGDLAVTATNVNIRRTAGYVGKAANDLLGVFDPRFTLNVLEGPRSVDSLTWWRVGGITLNVGEVIGWVAERAPDNTTLIKVAAKLPGSNIPDKASKSYLGVPFQGSFGIAQLWGENPQIYGRFSYDGVALKGHNGIDFLTPTGTNLLAVDDGVVGEAVTNDPSGFGNYVKLMHGWGESLYGHMDGFNVQPGQSVRRGQMIGRSGSTGFSNGPHLHFAIRINPYDRKDGWGGFSDPLPYLNPSDVHLPAYILDPPAASATLRLASPAPSAMTATRRPLDDAPGYAPDRPGLRRP